MCAYPSLAVPNKAAACVPPLAFVEELLSSRLFQCSDVVTFASTTSMKIPSRLTYLLSVGALVVADQAVLSDPKNR